MNAFTHPTGLAVLLDPVEGRPVVPLDLALGVRGHPGDEVAAHMHQTPLVQAVGQRALDRRTQALAAVGDDQQRGAKPAVGQVGQQARQAWVDSVASGARPRKTGLPSTSMPQAASTGSALALGCILKKLPSK
jgi:hypothetical protein